MTNFTLIVRYAGFAVLATLANLVAQRFVLWLDDGWFVLAVLIGTAIGLVLKYALDKRWIFYDALRSTREEGQKFTLYTVTGIGTTLVFWGIETAFWVIWNTHMMREVGAVIGLTIGYVVKFYLDRRFVFKNTRGSSLNRSDCQQD